MNRAKSYITLGCLASVFVTAACSAVMEKSQASARQIRQEQHEAQLLEKGEKALAACIRARCETLDIDGMRLDDFTVLNDLDHVTSIMMSRTNFDDLNDISGMSQLTELHISSSKVSDLDGLHHFPNLTLLHAQGLRSETTIDVTPVRDAKNLTELALWTLEDVDAVEVIQELPNLERLVVDWKGTEGSLAFLKGHPSLKYLEIGGARASDYSALLGLAKLETFSFIGYPRLELDPNIVRGLENRGVTITEVLLVMC